MSEIKATECSHNLDRHKQSASIATIVWCTLKILLIIFAVTKTISLKVTALVVRWIKKKVGIQEKMQASSQFSQRGCFFSFTFLLCCHLCPSLALNPAACGGKTNSLSCHSSTPRTLRCLLESDPSGLKCCHAELVPNCLPHSFTNLPATNKTHTVYWDLL